MLKLKKRMTIMLSEQITGGKGGRPMCLGKLIHGQRTGEWGIFMGYEPQTGNHIIISPEALERLLKGVNRSYKVRFEIKEQGELNFSKYLSYLIPQSLKKEIVRENLTSSAEMI